MTTETHPINFLLEGFPVFHNGNIYLIVLVVTHPICSFIVLLLVLVSKILTGDEQDEGGSDRTSADNSEGDPIPRLVLCLPDEWTSSVAHGVGYQDYSVHCDALRVARCRHSDPREEDGEWDDTPD